MLGLKIGELVVLSFRAIENICSNFFFQTTIADLTSGLLQFQISLSSDVHLFESMSKKSLGVVLREPESP